MRRFRQFLLLVICATSSYAQTQQFNVRPHPTAANCQFAIPNVANTVKCDTDLDRGVSTICTIQFVNNGTDPCTAHFEGYMGPATLGTVDQGSTTVIPTQCRTVGQTSLPVPAGVLPNSLESAVFCEGDGTVKPGETMTLSARITPSRTFPAGEQFIIGAGDDFGEFHTGVAIARFNLASCNLTLSAPSLVQSGVAYNLTWTAAQSQTTYEVQEATQPDFSDAKTTVANTTSQQYTHTASGAAATYYYRVRATSCGGSLGPYSNSATVTIAPAIDPNSKTFDIVLPLGSTTAVTQQIHLTGFASSVAFAASADQPFLTVTPATGTTSATGTVDLTVRADPSSLGVGANSGTITVTGARAKSGRITALDGNSSSVPITVSLATPVTQQAKTPPPSTTWTIPAVAHRDGIGAQFLSDVRLGNMSTSATSSYQLTFTAANTDGSKDGRQTKISLNPGQIAALNDVLRDVFGLGAATANASGVLEIRALGSSPPSGTVATSRTYSVATAGTFGQNVPAVPIDRVATSSERLILGHAGQTVSQRVNVGIVESLGFPVTGHIRAFNSGGSQIADQAFSLQAFEQQQINSFLARNGVNTSAARIDVIMDDGSGSPTKSFGGVTAYAAMLDNTTQDASVIAGIKASSLTAKRYVLPGVAEGTAVGQHSEVRVVNVGSSAANATFTLYPRGGSAIAKQVSIGAGELKSFDNIVSTLFGISAGDGSVVVTTPSDAQLLITGRTFSSASAGGTFGVLQQALLATDGIGSGDSDLSVLQLEESDRFRTDLGLVELTGAPVKLHVTLYGGDFKSAGSTDIDLGANEFRDDQAIAKLLGATGGAYNGRIAVRVLSGSGRVAAYGALIDKGSGDSTLLPAGR
jgi:hypothetical protein